MAVITLQQAKDHLNISTPIASPLDQVDRDITLKMAQAESIILDYIKSDNGWDEETVPPLVQAAVLYRLAILWRFRGDDGVSQADDYKDGQLTPFETNVLRRWRDPAMA